MAIKSKYKTKKIPRNQRYWSGNGRTYVIRNGYIVREATKKESKDAEKQAWIRLWDSFGEGLSEQ